jgi:hypothetical protein
MLPRMRAAVHGVPAWAWSGACVLAAGGFLLARLLGDVRDKPFYQDEALTGLIAVDPVRDIVAQVVLDRGGAPLHFILAHVALDFAPTVVSLRSLSVVLAVATIPLCYDLGRRLGGSSAGLVAAAVAASSSLLAAYGTFGRMYALFAFVAALSADLFLRALVERTAAASAAAAAAAWLLPATHPYGALVLGAEAVVALAVWRGRSLRPAVPVLLIALALVPFGLAGLRLGSRFEAKPSGFGNVIGPDRIGRFVLDTLEGFAGGTLAAAIVFLLIAVAGLVLVFRKRPAFAAYAVLAFAAPPLLLLVEWARGVDLAAHLSTRHMMFALPTFAALVGVGTIRIVARAPRAVALVVALAVVGLAAAAPRDGTDDPRTVASGELETLAAPAAWVEARVRPDDVLFPYSPVFFAALPRTAGIDVLPRASNLDRAVADLQPPVRSIYVAVPLDGGAVPADRLERVPQDLTFSLFPHWLLVQAPGPWDTRGATLAALYRAVSEARGATEIDGLGLRAFFRVSLATIRQELAAG